MQAAGAAAPRHRLRQRAGRLVQGIVTASAAEQTETGLDAGQPAPRVQTDRQGAVIADAGSRRGAWPVRGHAALCQITCKMLIKITQCVIDRIATAPDPRPIVISCFMLILSIIQEWRSKQSRPPMPPAPPPMHHVRLDFARCRRCEADATN